MPDTDDFQLLVTAQQAYPVFEKAVLGAERQVLAGFRIFDMMTSLQSDEALEIGDTWFDLIRHTLQRGVDFRLILSDFDPVMATRLHSLTWRTVRQAAALSEVLSDSPDCGLLQVIPATHPARAGLLPRLGFSPATLKKRWEAMRQAHPKEAVGLGDQPVLPQLHPVTHHQKLAVIDRKALYIGGLDLNNRRYDDPDHKTESADTWHDIQVFLKGPEAASAADHLEQFLDETAGKRDTAVRPGLLRTLSRPRKINLPFLSPQTTVRELEQAHLDAINGARHLIYIETQFLRSRVIAEALVTAAGRRDLRLVIVLPAAPEDVAFESSRSLDARYGEHLQADCLKMIMEAFEDRCVIAAPVQPKQCGSQDRDTLHGSPIIYVHSKVLVADDDYLLVSSANLNGRSLRWDTEAGVEIRDHDRVRDARRALLEHWWFDDPDLTQDDLTSVFDTIQKRVRDDTIAMPSDRNGFLVYYDRTAAQKIGQPVPGATENIV
ncbi:phospholipase D family protein [Pseudaestuariivita rosea]|uniref:phospholipase D family protein n=1 Tax=Pseudaestuariivita rosea TaxID=2763263 RepID=UPI00235036DD|nr:phospholipase D family protein [Pseudaestuariivita rosea]